MKVLLLHSFQDYLILAYSFMAAIAAFGYGPQIYTLIKSTGHSISTPITTWLLWTAEASVSFTYAIIVLRDASARNVAPDKAERIYPTGEMPESEARRRVRYQVLRMSYSSLR